MSTPSQTANISSILGLPSKFSRYILFLLILTGCASVQLEPAQVPPTAVQQKADEQNPLLLGYNFYTLKRFPYAEVYLEDAAQNNPLLRDYALHLLALSKREQGFDLEAAKAWEKLISLEPNSNLLQQARLNQAESYLKAQAYREAYRSYQAIHSLTRGKRLSKSEKKSLQAKVLLGEAKALEGMGNHTQAKSRYKEIMLSACGSEVLQPARETLEDEDEESGGEGLFSYSSLRAIFSDHEIRKLAQCFLKNGKAENALPLFQQMDGDKSIYVGQSLYALRHFDEALKVFESTLELHRPNKETLFWAAESASRLDQRQKAKQYYELFLKKFPGDSRSEKCRFHLAFTQYLEKEFEAAAVQFVQYYKKHPRNKKAFDAVWYAGWCHYRLQHYAKAIELWQSMLHWKKSLIQYPEQLHYWIARSLEHDEKDQAITAYQQIVEKWPYSFYATFANNRLLALGSHLAAIPAIPLAQYPDTQDPQLSFSDILEEKKNPPLPLKKAAALSQLGFANWASDELRRLQPSIRNHRDLLELALLFRSLEDYHHSSYIARVDFEDILIKPFDPDRDVDSLKRDLRVWSLAYPRAYRNLVEQNAKFNQLDPSLIWAVMRQESNYRPLAASKANAFGLMQLIPQTASKMAGKPVTAADLFEPAQNIAWGAKYLRTLMTDFQERLDFVAPSYNAGPEQTISWLKDRANLSPDEFIEEIPFRETRNFVKRVLRIASIYQMLYPKTTVAQKSAP